LRFQTTLPEDPHYQSGVTSFELALDEEFKKEFGAPFIELIFTAP
jgi:hypothetical protein